MSDDTERADDATSTDPADTILTLPNAMSGLDLAEQCRAAALDLVNESSRWARPELAMWLTGRYAPLTRQDTEGRGESAVWPLPLLREIDPRLVRRILTSARAEVIETLSAMVKDGSASFVLGALISGWVVRCEDARGEPTWAPTSVPTRLADRVLSLFAIDYLVRPGDYETSLFVCSRCEAVRFDPDARARGTCSEHHEQARTLVAPRNSPTLPYPPMGA